MSEEHSRNHSPANNRRSSSRSKSPRYDKRDMNPETYTQVYVAKLDRRTREDDLREKFQKYGRIKNIVLKTTYAFIDYDDHESAEQAVKEMNGKVFVNGEELVVE